MARQSFISNLGGYALKKLRLLINGTIHEYDTTEPADVTIAAGRQINIVSTDGSVDINENSTAQSVTFNLSANAAGSCLLTSSSDWQTLDGTDVTLRNIWSTGTPIAVTGDKIRLAINGGQTKYRVEVAKLGAYRVDVILRVKWDGTPVNKTGKIFGFAVDFSKHFETIVGRQSNIIEISGNDQAYYGFGFQVHASEIDAPNGVKLSIQVLVEYLGPVPAAEVP